ncbi:MAG: insulinase family protein [Bacilli bacterium]|nr:insulinase family protein [Bacilli bacterium]
MKYIKKEMGSYNLHMINTDRFKTINVEVILSNEIKKEEITITNFLSSILAYTTKKYPTKNALAIKLQDLYSARIFTSCYRVGNLYNVDFNLSMLDEKYSEEGMFEETLDLLKDILFDPNVNLQEFDTNSFNVIKNEEIAQIERFKEDSRKYSIIKMLNLLDENSVFAYNGYGYMEDLEKITPKNLYDFYNDFVKKSTVDIFVVGDIDFNKTEKIIKEKFKFRTLKKSREIPLLEVKEPRKKTQAIFEEDNTTQAKLSIGCLINKMSKFEREYVLNIYNLILGATADSKFFKNIREKYSMCYYVSSVGNKLDNLFIITSGIAKENFEKMITLINKEMNDMIEGNFSNEDIENAQKYYLSILEEVEDKPSQIISSYYAIDLMGIDPIETRKEKIMEVTKEDIMKLASKVSIDTIFLLGGDKK